MEHRFFTMYTKDTPYEAEAEKCVASFEKVGLTVCALPYVKGTTWMLNCMARTRFLLSLREQFPDYRITMFDADIEAKQYPHLLFCEDCDIAVEYRGDHVPKYRQYSAGVLSFAPTQAGKNVLELWAKLCKEDSQPTTPLREQLYLRMAIRNTHPLSVHNLPNSYNAKPEQVNKDTVLIHNVASRRKLHD